jgi:hypothetical protein
MKTQQRFCILKLLRDIQHWRWRHFGPPKRWCLHTIPQNLQCRKPTSAYSVSSLIEKQSAVSEVKTYVRTGWQNRPIAYFHMHIVKVAHDRRFLGVLTLTNINEFYDELSFCLAWHLQMTVFWDIKLSEVRTASIIRAVWRWRKCAHLKRLSTSARLSLLLFSIVKIGLQQFSWTTDTWDIR